MMTNIVLLLFVLTSWAQSVDVKPKSNAANIEASENLNILDVNSNKPVYYHGPLPDVSEVKQSADFGFPPDIKKARQSRTEYIRKLAETYSVEYSALREVPVELLPFTGYLPYLEKKIYEETDIKKLSVNYPTRFVELLDRTAIQYERSGALQAAKQLYTLMKNQDKKIEDINVILLGVNKNFGENRPDVNKNELSEMSKSIESLKKEALVFKVFGALAFMLLLYLTYKLRK